MSILSSIFILAGIFAFNNANSSMDFQSRLLLDQMKLKNLRLKVLSRDSSSNSCSQTYIKELSDVLEKYNSNMAACNDSKQTAIDVFNKDAMDKMLEFKSKIDSTCNSECASMTVATDGLSCIQTGTEASSKLLSVVSVEAATYKTELNKNLSNTEGIELVCAQHSNAEYSTKSDEMKSKYEKCLSGQDETIA